MMPRQGDLAEAVCMDLATTLWILAGAAAVTAAANLLSRRPYVPGSPPLIPYTAVQFVGLVVVLLMIIHLITLLTGKPFVGRRGF